MPEGPRPPKVAEDADRFSSVVRSLLRFRDDRDWQQFHRPKDLALAISVEAGELLEHFLWLDDREAQERIEQRRDEIGAEMADVLAYLIYLADVVGVDLVAALEGKVGDNGKRYPVDQARGSHAKAGESAPDRSRPVPSR